MSDSMEMLNDQDQSRGPSTVTSGTSLLTPSIMGFTPTHSVSGPARTVTSPSTSPAVIAGIVCGILGLLIIVIVVVILLVKRRRCLSATSKPAGSDRPSAVSEYPQYAEILPDGDYSDHVFTSMSVNSAVPNNSLANPTYQDVMFSDLPANKPTDMYDNVGLFAPQTGHINTVSGSQVVTSNPKPHVSSGYGVTDSNSRSSSNVSDYELAMPVTERPTCGNDNTLIENILYG